MDLKVFLDIVRRSWALVVALPLLAGLMTLALGLVLPSPYVLTAAMLVTQRPIGTNEPQITLPDENNRGSWAASEYIVDDILQLVETRRFADDIAAWAGVEQGRTLDPKRISENLTAERRHRMIYLTATAPRADDARLMVQGGIAMLQRKGLEYWGRQEATTLEVSALDLPERALRARGLFGLFFDAVLRGLLALILGIGLAFLRHYLDQSLRQRDQVEALGLEVIGAIQREQRVRRLPLAHAPPARPVAAGKRPERI